MINIDFPVDPSKLQFYLDRNIASTYLVAKAAKHYGAQNINVAYVSITSQLVEDDERVQSIHRIVDELGLTKVSLAHYTDHTKTKSVTEITDAYKRWINMIDPSYDDDADEITNIVIATFIVNICIHLGWMDRDLNLTSNADGRTYVGYLNDGGTVSAHFRGTFDLINHPAAKDHISAWNPLINYTDDEILQSAVEEGLIDIVKMTNLCEHSRPMHCGACNGCFTRRILFIENEIDDDTEYEYRN